MGMFDSEYTLDDDGTAVCGVCGRRYKLRNLDSCFICDKWVCKNCAKHKDPDGMGEVVYCPSCFK